MAPGLGRDPGLVWGECEDQGGSGQAWGLAHSLRALGTSPGATIVTEKWGVRFFENSKGAP